MRTFRAAIRNRLDGVTTIDLGFEEPAENNEIVRDAIAAIQALKLEGGKGVKLNGSCSLPAAIAIGHSVGHLFGYVAYFDPKLKSYVVCVSHDPAFRPGDVIPESREE